MLTSRWWVDGTHAHGIADFMIAQTDDGIESTKEEIEARLKITEKTTFYPHLTFYEDLIRRTNCIIWRHFLHVPDPHYPRPIVPTLWISLGGDLLHLLRAPLHVWPRRRNQ